MSDISSITLKITAKIRDAIFALDKSSKKIVLIVDDYTNLIGVVADGDIRRGLLKNIQLDDSIEKVILRNPITCKPEDEPEKLLEIALSKKIYQIPIVEKQGKLIGLYQVDDLIKPAQKSNPVVLMAGGMGTRLHPLTEDKPKPLLHVGGKPILETIIHNFKKCGFSNFYLSVNYKSEMIEDNFKDGSSLGVNINYIREHEQLGTAGALAYLKDKIKESFFVMNGDILTNLNFNDFLSFHQKHQSLATMGVRTYEHQIPYGVIQSNQDRITNIKEKPVETSLVNAGIYILEPQTLEGLKENERVDMPSIFDNLIVNEQKALSYLINDYWVDIGRLEELRRADAEFHEVF